MAASLGAPRGMIVEPVLLEGDPARRVVVFAAGVRGDLIATGSHGRGFVARLLVGSVATQIVRASPCSVLTMPRAA
jgi:nucleotide-binding universal stress UspA family protein